MDIIMMRFCASVIQLRRTSVKTVKDYHQVLSLECRIGPIFSECINYDLVVSTPNGRGVTYAIVIEFKQHPARIMHPSSATPTGMIRGTGGDEHGHGMMHTLVSFIGTIGYNIRATCVEELIGTADSSIADILNGKTWPKEMINLLMSILNVWYSEGLQGYATCHPWV